MKIEWMMSMMVVVAVAGSRVAEAQPSAAPAEDDARDRDEAAYDTAFIVFEDEYAAHISVQHYDHASYGSVTTTRNAVPIRGIQRERLSPVGFYDAIGRADLATEYQSGRRKQLVVGGVSVGAFVGSLVLGGIAFSKVVSGPAYPDCDVFSPTWDACIEAEDRREDARNKEAKDWAIGAGVAFIGGLAFGAIYRFMDPHPVSESERRMLAHDHNERLRRDLRLPRRRELSLAPFVAGEGGGLMAVGSF